LFRQHQLEPKRVHAISSISAMVQLVQGGFGVALLPRVAVQRLAGVASLKLLSCDAKLQALPIYASYRTDPTSQAVERVVKLALAFVEGAPLAPKWAPKRAAKKVPKG
jgi:DNA-binding transcriptional LysR family regulator